MSSGPFGFGDDPPSGGRTAPGRARHPFGERLGIRRPAPAGPPPSWAHGWTGSPRGPVRSPSGWLFAALAVAALAVAAALTLGGAVSVAVACWIAAGPVAIGLVSIFVLHDTRAAAEPIYLRPTWIRPLWAVTIIGVIAGIATSAWRIADWWGRL